MKKKELITIIIIAIVLAAILFGAIFLSIRHRFGNNDAEKTENIVRSGYQIKGYHLYFNQDGVIMKYNKITQSAEKLCHHEISSPNCPLETAKGNIFLYNERLYFKFGEENYVSYYDLNSGETVGLNISIDDYSDIFLYEGKIYYISESSIFFISADGGSAEKLRDIKSDMNSENIFMIAEGKIFTYTYRKSFFLTHLSQIFSYDIDTKTLKELHSFHTSDDHPVKQAKYFDGSIYFITSTVIPALDGIGFSNNNGIIRINIKNEEVNSICSESVKDYFLTDQNIYYVNDLKKGIIKIDHNGDDPKTVYTNPNLTYSSLCFINDSLLGLFNGECPELGIGEGKFYAIINLKDGSMDKVNIPYHLS